MNALEYLNTSLISTCNLLLQNENENLFLIQYYYHSTSNYNNKNMNIPLEIGFRFLPPDEQIISFFLINKIIGDHQTTQCIREVDLLNHEPWQLPAMSVVQSTYQEWFFFYKLNKISQRKNDRSTNYGFWKSTGTDRPIGNVDKVIGYKKTLVFYKGRTPHGIKTDWVMHEFRAHPDFVPPNADTSYVVGYLRNNAAEKTENSAPNIGQLSRPFVGSSSQNNELGVASMEVAHQTESDMDYAMALQIQMEDEGIFDYDLSQSSGLHDLPSTGAGISNDQNRIEEEEGICLEDICFVQTDGLVAEELNEWQLPYETNTEEFMGSLFHNQDERSNVEAERMLRSDTGPTRDNAWCDQIVHLSDGTGGGRSEGLHQKRMETCVHHDEILLMDSRVESVTVTAYEINCLESVKEERSVNSKACKSLHERRSHKSVAQRRPIRVQLQSKSLGKAVTRNNTRESRIRGPVTRPVQQAKRSSKMEGDGNTKLVSSSRSEGSVGSSSKNSFNFVDMSQQRWGSKPNPPLVYLGNVIVGLILFIIVVWEVMFIR